MTPQQFEQVHELMLEAREVSPERREAFLAQRCGDDPGLLAEVRSLLAADARPGDTLDIPPLGNNFSIDSVIADDEPPPDHIGRYHILGTLGEGGMGIVYHAEQVHPIQRKVAIKVIKLGFDSKEVIARFNTERQALAQMEHPNIARVIDAGTTDRGRPYFVMEHVPGVPITQFCDLSKLSIRQRLDLFIQVCDAISHAHAKATIHRDLKASNVLAYLQDQKPTIKVIDFGIAKALTSEDAAHQTQHTHGGQVLGTFESMSPEQAAGLLDIDTRTDVYSLGLLLYRLLAGVGPVDHETLMKSGTEALRRTIREDDSIEPSTRLTKLAGKSLTSIAADRQTSPQALVRSLRGDLDWIVMRCLERDRERRYPTVNALSMDIQRHLNNEPIVARPRTAMYRFHKLVRRNPLATALTTALAAVLVLASVISIRAAIHATDLRRQAETARSAEVGLRQQTAYQAYVANIAAADAALTVNEAYWVRRRLNDCPPEFRNWEWNFLLARSDDSLIGLSGHTTAVNSAAFSPDGSRVVTASHDRTARIWNAATGRELVKLLGHQGAVQSAAFSPDGKRIVTASQDHTARIWDAADGNALVVLSGHGDYVQTAAFNSDGSRIVTASWDGTVRIWDAAVGTEVLNFRGHVGKVYCAAFSPDGQRVVTAGDDMTARIWDASSGRELLVLRGNTGAVGSAFFSPDATRIITSGGRGTVRVWSATDGENQLTLSQLNVRSAAFSPNGKEIVTPLFDGQVCIWNAASGRQTRSLRGHQDVVTTALFSPDGTQLVTASRDGTARIWDATGFRQSLMLQIYGSLIHSAQFNPDGTRIVTASSDKTAWVWQADSAKEQFALRGHEDSVNSAMFSPDGSRIVTASSDKTARIWDAARPRELLALRGHEAAVNSAAFSPDGSRIVTASSDKTARIWDAVTGRSLMTLLGHDERVAYAAFSPDGARVVTASDDYTARIWDATSGTELLVLRGHDRHVGQATFSPDGTRIVTASADSTGRVWNAADGKEMVTLRGHQREVYAAAFSPDGTRIVTTSLDTTARVHDAATGELLLTLRGHLTAVCDAAFSADGTRIITAAWDGTARIWDSTPHRQRYFGQPSPGPAAPEPSAIAARPGESDPPAAADQQPAVLRKPGPALLVPAEGAVLENGTMPRSKPRVWEFRWAEVPGATHYGIHVHGPAAQIPMIDLDVSSTSHRDSAYGYVADRNRKGWRWRVRAMVDGVWSDWSETRTFDIAPLQPATTQPDEPNPSANPTTRDTPGSR